MPSDSVHTTLTYGPIRPWGESWARIVRARRYLDDPIRGTEEARDRVRFFGHELGVLIDALRADRDVDRATVAAAEVERHTRWAPLWLGQELANTIKHQQRQSNRPMVKMVSVGDTLGTAGLWTMRLEVTAEGDAPQSYDVRSFADSVLEGWREFFRTHNLDAARWDSWPGQ